MKILVTGAAGFIGFHTTQKLINDGHQVIGIDNQNGYYDPALKTARLNQLQALEGFTFYPMDIADEAAVHKLEADHSDIEIIIHLAAQAGVRYSIENPQSYVQSNLVGHANMLELARHLHEKGHLKHFVYASSSSVYGANKKTPFSVEDVVRSPVSFYAATKAANELMSQSYAHLYRLPATGLRFFTVYGPYGRPDMAYFSFTKAILEGKPITVFNNGDMRRDFTWIDDIVDGVTAVMNFAPTGDAFHTIAGAPHRVFNLGNNKAEKLLDFIETIEKALGKTTQKIMADMAAGDVKETFADITAAQEIFGYNPKTPISKGIPAFVEWYKDFYQ
ncbi:MAG: capsular biosynthesis protein CpsI [Micavibrio sp.]|nr:capsular biosynthesis protein CpsI [Micavibrio sp.]